MDMHAQILDIARLEEITRQDDEKETKQEELRRLMTTMKRKNGQRAKSTATKNRILSTKNRILYCH